MFQGSQSMVKKLKTVIIKHPREAFISQAHLDASWKTFHYTDCPDWDKALQEYEKFEAILREHVANVLYLPQSDKTGLDSLYAHDPVSSRPKARSSSNPAKSCAKAKRKCTRSFCKQTTSRSWDN